MTGRSNRFRFWWPVIVDEQSARDAAGIGAGMAAFQAIVILLVVVTNRSGITPVWGFNLRYLSFLAVFVLLAWLIYWRLSRTAAAFALLLAPVGRMELFNNGHPYPPLDLRLLIYPFMYIHGVRGTFAYHKFDKQCQQAIESAQCVATDDPRLAK